MNQKPVRTLYRRDILTDGIGKRRDLAHSVRHGENSLLGQKKAVDHHVGYRSACGINIGFVCAQDLVLCADKRVRHGKNHFIFALRIQARHMRTTLFCLLYQR